MFIAIARFSGTTTSGLPQARTIWNAAASVLQELQLETAAAALLAVTSLPAATRTILKTILTRDVLSFVLIATAVVSCACATPPARARPDAAMAIRLKMRR